MDQRVRQLMKEKGMNDVLLTGGGIIPEDDMQNLRQLGCGELFSPGTNTAAITNYIKQQVQQLRNF